MPAEKGRRTIFIPNINFMNFENPFMGQDARKGPETAPSETATDRPRTEKEWRSLIEAMGAEECRAELVRQNSRWEKISDFGMQMLKDFPGGVPDKLARQYISEKAMIVKVAKMLEERLAKFARKDPGGPSDPGKVAEYSRKLKGI